MSEQLYGESRPLEERLGFTEMKVAFAVHEKEPEVEETFDPNTTPISPREAAELREQLRSRPEVVDRPPEPTELPPTEIAYREVSGPNAGQVKPENETVTFAQSVHDRALMDQAKADTLEAIEAQQVRDAVDQLRATHEQTQPQQPSEINDQFRADAAQQQQEQPQDRQARVQKLLQDNPELVSELQQEINMRTAQAEAARQQYETAAINAGRTALAGIVASFPELAGVPAEQWGVAILGSYGMFSDRFIFATICRSLRLKFNALPSRSSQLDPDTPGKYALATTY